MRRTLSKTGLEGTKPVRVLFVSHTPSLIGGADFCLKEILDRIDRDSIHPHVVLPYMPNAVKNSFCDLLIRNHIPYTSLEIIHWVDYGLYGWVSRPRLFLKFFTGFIGRIRGFISLIKKEEIDVIYSNTITVLEGAVAAWLTGKPHIWHIHEAVSGNVDLLPLFPERIIKFVVQILSKRIIFPSKFLAFCAYGFKVSNKRILVIPNGVDLNRFKENRAAKDWLASLANIPVHSRIIASIGNFTKRKRMDDFIKAAAITKVSRDNGYFIVVGHGSKAACQELRLLSHELGVADNVRLIPWTENIDMILAGIDLLVVASDQETFGRTIIEAMACGCPVISTRCGGPEELIDNGETGVLVSVGAPQELAEVIDNMVYNGEISAGFIRKAKNIISSSYGLDRYIAHIEDELIGVAR